MRKTLFAVGFAVLVSMMLAPHGEKDGIEGWGPFFLYGHAGRVMIDMLALEMVFLGVLFAVVVNLSRRSRRVALWTTAAVAAVLAAGFVWLSFRATMVDRASSERWMARDAISKGQFELAKEHLVKAADYLWWTGNWGRARETKREANDRTGMEQEHSEMVKTELDSQKRAKVEGVDLGAFLAKYASPNPAPAKAEFDPDAYLAEIEAKEDKLVHDPIDYQLGTWTTGTGQAFVVAKFFERNLGDRKAELDVLADQLGAQKRYVLIEKQKRGGVWWVRVYLYKQ